MSTTYAYTANLTVIECCLCHMDFAMTDEFDRQRRSDHELFYCPAGHAQHFAQKSQTEKLTAELEAARKIAANERDWRRRETELREHAERQRAAARGQVTKIKRRVGRGVCPCCNLDLRRPRPPHGGPAPGVRGRHADALDPLPEPNSAVLCNVSGRLSCPHTAPPTCLVFVSAGLFAARTASGLAVQPTVTPTKTPQSVRRPRSCQARIGRPLGVPESLA